MQGAHRSLQSCPINAILRVTLLQSLLAGLQRRSVSAVRVIGPHGSSDMTVGCQLSPPDSWRKYDALLLIGGGIGVRAMLLLLPCLMHAAC